MNAEEIIKATGQGLGLALFAWAIYREQVAIRKRLHRISNLLTGIGLAVGVELNEKDES